MGRAFLSLYTATADARYLTRSVSAAQFIKKTFALNDAGYRTAIVQGSFPAQVQIDKNVSLSRFTNLLHAYTGKPELRQLAKHAMKYLAAPQIAGKRTWVVGGILLADRIQAHRVVRSQRRAVGEDGCRISAVVKTRRISLHGHGVFIADIHRGKNDSEAELSALTP